MLFREGQDQARSLRTRPAVIDGTRQSAHGNRQARSCSAFAPGRSSARRRALSSIVRNRISPIFSTPIRSSRTKWSRMQNKLHPAVSRRGSCVRTSQRAMSHSPALVSRVGNARGRATWMPAGFSRWSSRSQNYFGTIVIPGDTQGVAEASPRCRRYRRRDRSRWRLCDRAFDRALARALARGIDTTC
jgi:hypothetical protein